jgi:hypothetical protein
VVRSIRFRFLLISVGGWINQQQQHAIDYLREENRVPSKYPAPTT